MSNTPKKDILNDFGIDGMSFLQDEFDDAIIGYSDDSDFNVVYDSDKVDEISKETGITPKFDSDDNSPIFMTSNLSDISDDTVIFSNPSYDTAKIGICDDGRLVYDYELMANWLMKEDDMEYPEAVDFIDYNTIRAIPYFKGSPIVVHNIEDYIDYK